MAIEAFAKLNCSIARLLSFLGERWALLVLRDLSPGRRRFDEIQESLGVAGSVLSQRGKPFHLVPTCSERGGELDWRHVHSRPGPGATDEQRRRADRQRRRVAERRAA
jgi:hypothetical protein